MKQARPWKKSELVLLAAPLFVLALWLGWGRASKYLERPQVFGHQGYTAQVVFSPDGKYLLSRGSWNNRIGVNEVALWDWRTRTLKHVIQRVAEINSIALDPSGKQAAF